MDMRNTKNGACALICNNWKDENAAVLVITEDASQKMLDYIGWNKADYLPNRVEQGGWLVGHYVYDCDGNVQHAEVTHVYLATNCVGTPVSLDWPAMEDIRLQRMFFDMKERLALTDPAASESLALIGWFHTHPQALDVFLSSTDFQNINRSFYRPNQFSIVLNPHRLIWKAYRGASGQPCNAIMYLNQATKSPTKPRKKSSKRTRKQKRMKYMQKKQRKAAKRQRKRK